jgi:hypothetical protein
MDNLQIAQQDRDRLAALQTARAFWPNASPDAVMNNLIDRLQNVSLTTPAPPRPTRVPEKQRVFTTDQERTAYILQREANTSRSLVNAVQNITAMTLRDDKRLEDLRPTQAAAFAALTDLLQQNVRTIKENKTLISQMVNPNIGRSKQTLDLPVLVPAPIGHKPHHLVMNTSTLKDNIIVFNPMDPNADVVRTWDQIKQYGTKLFFTEEDYITAWTKVTSSDTLQQLHNMIHSKYSLAKIFKFWEELYSKTRSITDQQEIIDSFQRKKKEALVAAMLRVTVDIDQMEYAEDPAAWNGIRDKQRRDILMKIILPETFSYLRRQREAYEKNGYLLKVDEMIQEGRTFKQSYNYVPQKDYPEHVQIPSANNSIMPILSWNPRGNFQNKPQPMIVDQPIHQPIQRFTQPPPAIVINPQQQQQRGQTTSKQPYDKNCQQSQQSRSGSNGSSR